ncbi:cold shock domain-containing protein [Hyphococcus sp.]|uniref:cold shock domain-containing protein n=1 Tax=Hyphococcus sp. TaxID=2038636 RepID=UPI003CCC1C4B
MLNLDAAYEAAKKIVDDASGNIAKIRTEEDSKIQIITRIITESLGWNFSDISAETRHDNGYSDYILSDNDNPSIMIEAKRVGGFKIKTTEKAKAKYLKLSGPSLTDAASGIEQAAQYAAPNGLSCAVLTDGISWIFFKTFVPRENYKQKEAVVFPSLESLLADFSLFYDLLAKSQVQKKLYNIIFDQIHNRRVAIARSLTAPITEADVKLVKKSELAFDLEKVFASFFDRLTGTNDEDLLVECFVETRESRIADFSLEKMTANVLGNISPREKEIDQELAILIESSVEVESDTTVFIVGPTGAGKSTFLERFFKKTLSPSIRNQCIVVRVNCLDSSGRDDTVLKWLTEQLIEKIEALLYEDGAPSWEQLRALYHSDYIRQSKGTGAELYKRNKREFQEKFGEYLHGLVEKDREGYLRRLIADIVSNRKKLPIFIIDNTDEFLPEFKKAIFQFAQSIRRNAKHCMLLFPVTDKSAWAFSKTDIYGIYQSKSFFLPTPPPREVFRKRIDFLKKKLAPEIGEAEKRNYFTQKGIKVSIANLEKFAGVIENVFVDHDYAASTVGRLANYNMRRTLQLSQRVITSSVFNIEDLISSYISGTAIAPNYAKFMNALLKGDYNFYKQGDQHEVYPLFQRSSEFVHSPLLALSILSLLDTVQKHGKNIEQKHETAQSVIDYFEAMGCAEVACEKTLLALIEANLIEPYDQSIRDLSHGQRLAISFSGWMHLQLALGNEIFIEQMALITALENADMAARIRGLVFARGPYLERANEMRKLFINEILAEDKALLIIPDSVEHFENQRAIRKQLGRFNSNTETTSGSNEKKDGDALTIDAHGVVATVDWFDKEKGYGFVFVDGIDGGIFLHAEKLNAIGLTEVADGDDILCDIEKTSKGISVAVVHEIETDPQNIEVAACQITRLFPERGYGFVSIEDSERDAFFHYSLFTAAEKEKLVTGRKIKAEIGADKDGKGDQVRRILEWPQ